MKTMESNTPEHLPKETDLNVVEHNIQKAIASHAINDPMLDPEIIAHAQEVLEKGDEKAELRLEDILEDDSIYPEVRAAVSNIDDPTMPVNTLRAWVLGMIASTLLAGINQFFIFQTPIVTISGLVIQLVSFPVGKAMAKIPYPEHWPLAKFVNPGPFNIKEHTLITVMATVSSGSAYATEIIATQHIFYGSQLAIGYQFLLVLSTQMIGFAFAGLARKFLVWPAAMIWPSNLPVCALMNTLHKTQEITDGRWSRNRMFFTVLIGIFCWEFVPGYLFVGLSYFSWITWIAPNNPGVNVVFGASGGIGLFPVCFDWSVITSYLLSPLMVPWFAEANVMFGYLVVICFVSPIIWAKNVHNTAYLPFASSLSYDRFGNTYSSRYILTPEKTFDDAKYESYSRQYLPATFLIAYGFGFASVTASITHAGFYYGKDIVRQFKRSLSEEPDVHSRLMSRYKEVPHWWYAAIFLISFGMAIPAVKVYGTELPVWALCLAIVLAAIYIVPIGIIQAITAQQVGLNVITEMILGYMLPGRPVAMMCFKTFGYITMAQALSFISDLKLGHYLKIPPRTMFSAQVVSQIWSSIVQIGVTNWVFGNVKGLCTADANPRRFTCNYTKTFYTASIIWGLIGPKKNFGAGAPYAQLNWMFLIGAILPIPTYFLVKKYPRSILRYLNWPLIFTGIGYFPPATGGNYMPWFLIGFIFQVSIFPFLPLTLPFNLPIPLFSLSVRHPPQELPVLVELQLRHLCRARLWHCHRAHHHLARSAIPQLARARQRLQLSDRRKDVVG